MSQLPDYTRGDTLDSLVFTVSFTNDTDEVIDPIGNVGSARLYFRALRSDQILCEFSSLADPATLEVTDATNWVFTTVPQVVTTTYAGKSRCDLEVTYTDPEDSLNKVLTIAKATMTILPDVTRDDD